MICDVNKVKHSVQAWGLRANKKLIKDYEKFILKQKLTY